MKSAQKQPSQKPQPASSEGGEQAVCTEAQSFPRKKTEGLILEALNSPSEPEGPLLLEIYPQGDGYAAVFNQATDNALESTPLTEEEEQLLSECEADIEKGKDAFLRTAFRFYLVRSMRLFRAHHRTFQHYCEDRWGFSRQRGYQLAKAGEYLAALPAGAPLPVNESQIRAKTKLDAAIDSAREAKKANTAPAGETSPEGPEGLLQSPSPASESAGKPDRSSSPVQNSIEPISLSEALVWAKELVSMLKTQGDQSKSALKLGEQILLTLNLFIINQKEQQ